MTVLGTFTSGQVLTSQQLNQLNNVTALELTSIFTIPTGAATNITFGAGTETVDVSTWHDTSSNTERITPTINGYYLVSAWVRWNETALNDYGLKVLKNSTVEAEVWLEGDYFPAGGVSKVILLNGTTDYIRIQGQTSSGVSRFINRAGLSVMLLRSV